MSSNGKSQFQARLENQKAQLERHGNFAEVVIRTTPEGTDMINFARMWEHILLVADRQTRGYIAKNSREDFDATRKDFQDSMEFMIGKMKDSIARHNIDLAGSNFISRIAQRYEIAERKRGKPQAQDNDQAEAAQPQAETASAAQAEAPAQQAEKPAAKTKAKAKPATPAPEVADDAVDGF